MSSAASVLIRHIELLRHLCSCLRSFNVKPSLQALCSCGKKHIEFKCSAKAGFLQCDCFKPVIFLLWLVTLLSPLLSLFWATSLALCFCPLQNTLPPQASGFVLALCLVTDLWAAAAAAAFATSLWRRLSVLWGMVVLRKRQTVQAGTRSTALQLILH